MTLEDDLRAALSGPVKAINLFRSGSEFQANTGLVDGGYTIGRAKDPVKAIAAALKKVAVPELNGFEDLLG